MHTAAPASLAGLLQSPTSCEDTDGCAESKEEEPGGAVEKGDWKMPIDTLMEEAYKTFQEPALSGIEQGGRDARSDFHSHPELRCDPCWSLCPDVVRSA